MRTYFHFLPTCPNCHEPHKTGNPLDTIEDNLYKCDSCMAVFHNRVDLTPYEKTSSLILKNEDKIEALVDMPLLWKVSSNPVEISYMEWLSTDPDGKYLVTWPWSDVKFIPIMITEYLLQNPDKTVAVIGTTSKTEDKKIGFQGLNEIFDRLIYLDDYDENLPDDLRPERNRFGHKDVLLKTDRTYYVIRKHGSDQFEKGRKEGIFDGTPEKCRRTIFSDLEEEYGENCIRIYQKIPSKRKPRTLNIDGFFDVTVGIREEWTGKLRYNKTWLWQILSNEKKIRRPSLLIKTVLIDDDDIPPLDSGIYFISDKLNPRSLFDHLNEINPDLIIFEDVDNYMLDQIYGGFKSKNFIEFLEKSGSNILMFSTKPDIRHLFRINSDDSFLERYNIYLHSWDSGIVYKKLKDKIDAGIRSPLTSTREELPDYGKLPTIEYKTVSGLDKLDEVIPRIKDIDSTYIRYIKDLKKSPLIVKGDYNRPEIFKRTFGDFTVHYDKMISKIIRWDDKLALEVMEIFNGFYDITGTNHNPVFEDLSALIRSLLQNENNIVTIVVHGLDVRGTIKLLKEKGFENYIPDRLDVLAWKKLSLRDHDIGGDENHFVISLRPPSLDYHIYFARNIEKLIFIGSANDLENTKKILKSRLNDALSRPVVYPDDSAPELLKDTLKDFEFEFMKDDSIDFFTESQEEEFSFADHISESATDGRTFRHRILKKGDEAVLALDESGNCMFLPLKKSIFFRKSKSGSVEEITIKKESIDRIMNKEIIVDRRGIYTSFKHVFTRFMFEKAKNIQIQSGFYQWDNFSELFSDSIEWIRVLRQTLKLLMRKSNLNEAQAEEKLSKYLSSLNLNAKNPDYIKNWWSVPEMISTELGTIPVYDIEHPKSRHDVVNIYKGIKEDLFPDMKLDLENAERSYIAARTLQKLRRGFFKNQLQKIPSRYNVIYDNLRNEIQKIIDGSDSFTVSSAMVVRIKNEVHILETLHENEALKSVSREDQ